MKKILFSSFLVFVVLIANAQADSTFKDYTGKYKFPDGSPVPETSIYIENGLLMASSSNGTTELKKIDTDVFEIVAYSGTATFKRTDGKVTSVQIQVGDLNMEGTKTELFIAGVQMLKSIPVLSANSVGLK